MGNSLLKFPNFDTVNCICICANERRRNEEFDERSDDDDKTAVRANENDYRRIGIGADSDASGKIKQHSQVKN